MTHKTFICHLSYLQQNKIERKKITNKNMKSLDKLYAMFSTFKQISYNLNINFNILIIATVKIVTIQYKCLHR